MYAVSIVGIVIRLRLTRLGNRGSNPNRQNTIISSRKCPERPCGSIKLLFNGYRIYKWSGREADHSPSGCSEINAWYPPSTLPQAFVGNTAKMCPNVPLF